MFYLYTLIHYNVYNYLSRLHWTTPLAVLLFCLFHVIKIGSFCKTIKEILNNRD